MIIISIIEFLINPAPKTSRPDGAVPGQGLGPGEGLGEDQRRGGLPPVTLRLRPLQETKWIDNFMSGTTH